MSEKMERIRQGSLKKQSRQCEHMMPAVSAGLQEAAGFGAGKQALMPVEDWACQQKYT